MIGNTLVIYIVCTVNHMRSSTNTLIANMAIADLLMAIDVLYILKWFYVYNTWFGTFMGTVLCKFFHSAQVGSLAASVFSLVAISLDRSFAILFPMKTIMTRNVVRFSIAIIWLCALALSIPLMVASKNVQLEGTEIMICKEIWEPMSRSTYSLVLFVTGYVVPLVIIAIVYCLAGLRLWSRKLPGHRNKVAEKKAQATSRRATAMLITVVIVFVLSWLPFQVFEMIHQYNPPLFETIPIEIYVLLPWFGYANSAINPIIYVIFSENYRQEFYRILCRGPSRQDLYKRAIIKNIDTDKGNTRTTLGQSCESSLAVDTSQTRQFRGSSLAVDIPLASEPRGSTLAVDIPLTCESRKSTLAVDKPSIPKSFRSSVDIPFTRESRGSPLAVSLTSEFRVSSLTLDIPITTESRLSSLAVDTLLTRESRVSPLAVNIPVTSESHASSLATSIPLTPHSRERSLPSDEVEVTRL